MPSNLKPGLFLVANFAIFLSLTSPVKADEKCNLAIRSSFRKLIESQSATQQWISVRRIDSADSQSRRVARDEVVFAAEFRRIRTSNSMVAPNDFKFRSGWVLNTQFAFHQGTSLPIKAVYNLPSGETYYALAPPTAPKLTIFAKPDGTLCNKVMNTDGGDHVFLVKEYQSSPTTRLAMADEVMDKGSPFVLKVIYLGSSGGVASFRAMWSRDGKILQKQDYDYDLGASHIVVAGIDIPVSGMTADSAAIGPIHSAERIELGPNWPWRFSD